MFASFKKCLLSLSVACIATASHAQDLPGPNAIQTSDIKIRAEYVGTMPTVPGPGLFLGAIGPNLQSPVPADNAMYFIDHIDAIYAANRNGKGLRKIFSIADGDAPPGLIFEGPISNGTGGTIDYKQRQAVFNVSPGKADDVLYVVLVANFGSTLPPPPIPHYKLPPPISGPCCFGAGTISDLYNVDPAEPAAAGFPFPFAYPGVEHQILYEFTIGGKGLSNPRPIAIFDSQGGPMHHGSAMLTLDDGRILYVTGDALPFGLAGDVAPQDPTSHLSKLLIVDPADGSIEVAASGLRNVQHMEFVSARGVNEEWIAFADIGGWTAEEVNTVRLADILDTSTVENFGWGLNPDGFAREGTFYVGPGQAFSVGTPPVIGPAPSPEPGFIQPHAQYERPNLAPAPGTGDPLGGLAASGPVTSKEFKRITMLFSDLDSSRLYATLDPLDTVDATVYTLKVMDEAGNEYESLEALAGLPRVDPRMFRFADGSPGVLLEATGDYYRLKEVLK